MVLLEVNGLSKRFGVNTWLGKKGPGATTAVEDASFSIAKGRTLCLVGESGCGKTTLCMLVLRLCAADSGSVLLDGENILGFSEKRMREARRRMQPVFQNPFTSLDPRQRIASIVEEPLAIHTKWSRSRRGERVAHLLERVGLSSAMALRFPHELSGGERQRVALARALACSPDILVLDEPVSNLDVSIQAQVINLIRDCQEELGVAILFVSHQLSIVRQVADTVCVMRSGRIVETGSAESFFSNPSHPYAKLFLDSEMRRSGGRGRLEPEPRGRTGSRAGS